MNAFNELATLIQTGWTQEANARDAYGFNTSPESPKATCWCLHGAVCRLALSNEYPYDWTVVKNIERALDAAAFMAQRPSYVVYNDTPNRTKEDILSLIEEARGLYGTV
jgi:hypothetical protein